MLLNGVQTSEMDETLEPLSGIFCGDKFCNNSRLQSKETRWQSCTTDIRMRQRKRAGGHINLYTETIPLYRNFVY